VLFRSKIKPKVDKFSDSFAEKFEGANKDAEGFDKGKAKYDDAKNDVKKPGYQGSAGF